MLPSHLKALWSDNRATFAAVAAILAMVTLNQLGTGILTAIIPVRLAAEGHPASAAGAISTVFSACFLVGCLIGPRVVHRLGPTRTLFAIAAVNAAIAVLHWTFPGPAAWAAIRGIGGLATATYFVLVESWIASQTTPETRGLIFGVYMVLIRLAFALGQLIIAFVDPLVMTHLFFAAALAYLISPLLRPRTGAASPPMTSASLTAYLELPRRAPAAAVAAFTHGLLFATIPGLLPKWGIDSGMTIAAIAGTLSVMQLGGLVLQLPISYASDRIERRTIMAAAALGTAIAPLVVMNLTAVASSWLWLPLMLVWGGFASSLYSLGLAHASDLAPPEQRVAWVSSLMLTWGTGAMLGPLAASLLMDTFGPSVLWTYGLTVSLSVTAFFLARKVIRPSR